MKNEEKIKELKKKIRALGKSFNIALEENNRLRGKIEELNKCSICGKDNFVTKECANCYMKGCKKELDKLRKIQEKKVKKLKEKLESFYGKDCGWLEEIDKIFGDGK